ncbi:MAG TPA: recombination regulator RecX [Chlorobaculum parvum]|uniref:Regulatory protein RecX n=1 Tax=Chlorobaculum parvum TaxID=274539 RepID=A0A7C5DD90_9CHLB|nr:recombination regulator RecX [Chlorobaculum parvum]
MAEDRDRKNTLDHAMRLLTARDHGRTELETKLQKKGFDPVAVASALERLDQLDLLDDHAFAKNCVTGMARRRPEGKFKTRSRLRQKGLSDEVIEEALAKCDQSELCRNAAERKLRTLKGPPETVRKKLTTFLRNRGFDWETIRDTVELVPGGEDEMDRMG